MKKKKSKFFTFILSIIPGLGHFYLGFMHRGLQFMVAFFLAIGLMIVVASSFHFGRTPLVPIFGIAAPIVWFYTLFDALSLSNRLRNDEEVEDLPAINLHMFKKDDRFHPYWAYAFSIIPGLGHIFLGLHRRGIQILGIFFITFYILDQFRLDVLSFISPVIWFASLYDVSEQIGKWRQNGHTPSDTPVLRRDAGWRPTSPMIGVTLILVAFFIFVDAVILRHLTDIVALYTTAEFAQQYFNYAIWGDGFRTFMVVMLILGFGIYLLRKPRVTKAAPTDPSA